MKEIKNTERFVFKVANGKDEPSIWFRIHGREVIVHPFNLYDILWNSFKKYYFSWGIIAKIHFGDDVVYGNFYDEIYGSYSIDFDKSSFVESAMHALIDCCDAVLRGDNIKYEDFGEQAAKQMLIGLKDLRNKIYSDENNMEHFSFEFVQPYACDTSYEIKIDDKTYISALSDWTTDFNKIRLEIEHFIFSYRKDVEINLYYEDSPTIIRLRNQLNYNNDKDTIIIIIPDEFAHVPKIYGYCDTRQLVQALYLGLLGLCIRESDWSENRYGWSWEKFRLATYNKLQSCVIEDFIMGIEEEDFTYRPRQRVINSVAAMLKDYKTLQNTLAL